MSSQQYQIITDATSDLSPEQVNQLGVDVIPMTLDLSGTSYTFGSAYDSITTDEFYTQLRQGKIASTSQINPTVYQEHFTQYLEQGLDILYICFSSGLSGTIQAARLCMADLQEAFPDRTLLCVDSLCATGGEGFLVREAVARQKAGLPISKLAQWLDEEKLHVSHWFTVDDLAHLRRGGRISATTALVGSALQIKPVLHVDNEGRLVNMGKARGRKRSIIALADHMDATWTPERGKLVHIAHGCCPEDADFLRRTVQKRHPDAEITVYDVGPIVGAHGGVGILTLFFWGKER